MNSSTPMTIRLVRDAYNRASGGCLCKLPNQPCARQSQVRAHLTNNVMKKAAWYTIFHNATFLAALRCTRAMISVGSNKCDLFLYLLAQRTMQLSSQWRLCCARGADGAGP